MERVARCVEACGWTSGDIKKDGHFYNKHEMDDKYYRNILFYKDSEDVAEQILFAKMEIEKLREPLNFARELMRVGKVELDARINELSVIATDKSLSKFKRFKNMILSIYKYLEDRNMRMETFQLELMRGTVLGLAKNQLKDDLYKYKHKILDILGLATPEIKTHNPMAPSPETLKLMDEIFDPYATPYTLGMAPRQAGKTTIMSLILSGAVLFLELSILVIAQTKNMSQTIYNNMNTMLNSLQDSSWFKEEWKSIGQANNTLESKTYFFKEEYKKPSRISFLSSSPNVSIFLKVSNGCGLKFDCEFLQVLKIKF